MISSIYDSPLGWQNNKYYDKNDVIKEGGLYYYALKNHTSHLTQIFSFEKDSKWGGISSVYGKVKPLFLWSPSYNLNIKNKPAIKSIKYGNGYEQVSPDGINNDLITLNLSFENRDYNEFAAISHFLKQRNAVESFLFSAPNPLNKLKLFRCEEWDGIFNFIGNNSIQSIFKEVLV